MTVKLSRILREIFEKERVENIKEIEKNYGVLEDGLDIPEEDLIFDEVELGKAIDEVRRREKKIKTLEEYEKFC